jgi:hypothetical protein
MSLSSTVALIRRPVFRFWILTVFGILLLGILVSSSNTARYKSYGVIGTVYSSEEKAESKTAELVEGTGGAAPTSHIESPEPERTVLELPEATANRIHESAAVQDSTPVHESATDDLATLDSDKEVPATIHDADTSTTVHEPIPSTAQIDRTDPLDVNRELFYGPWRADIPATVIAGHEFEMTFHCTSPDPKMCPPSYIVLFHGPSRHTVRPKLFSHINSIPDIVVMKWSINDPGEYAVYAYPDFSSCISEEEIKWNAGSVEGSPLRITVQPGSRTAEEGYEVCSSQDIGVGRYLSTTSATLSDIFANSSRTFAWAPYKCKIPPRTISQALDLIPSAKHFLFVGDSTTRGPFCVLIWEKLHGGVEGSACDYRSAEVYRDVKWDHKFTSKVVNVPDEPRNVSFSALWGPSSVSGVSEVLLSLTDPPPTHVVFNVGLYNLSAKDVDIRWLPNNNVEYMQRVYWEFLEFMKEHFSNSVEHILLRITEAVIMVPRTSVSLIYQASPLRDELPELPCGRCRRPVSGRLALLSKRRPHKASCNL